ncbi:MAG TPA: GNAT family N-acetyltransferase [Acidobacteriota bacterium]|nr:GNAT family N-acetyltransferase [Acidobacteriota bacterium]
MIENAMNIELLDFEADQHLLLLRQWMVEPHVSRWWGNPESNLLELSQRNQDTQAIIGVDGKPVGYLCWQTPSQEELLEAGLSDLPGDIVDVDIMIGEVDALGKGVGPKALRSLFERLKSRGVSLVGLAGAIANDRAMVAYKKAGLIPFRDFFECGEQYRYFTISLSELAKQDAPADGLVPTAEL